MSNQFPPDDDLSPEMTPLEAFTRAMRIKLQRNREARAALKASEKSAQAEPNCCASFRTASSNAWAGQELLRLMCD